jgi:hypothetical protein
MFGADPIVMHRRPQLVYIASVMAENHGAQYSIKNNMLFLCTSIIDRTFESIKLISIYFTEFTQFLGGQPRTTASGK